MGLIRGVARTAVIAGTATAVSNRVSRRQGERWQTQAEAEAYEQQQQALAYQQQAAAAAAAQAPPPASPQDDKMAKLQQLGELKAAGVLTEEEFAAEKAKILAG
jgi:hypothetical protein